MIEFLIANMGTIIVSVILAAAAAMIIIKLKKDKKSGISSCGGSCGCCPNSAMCHSQTASGTKDK